LSSASFARALAHLGWDAQLDSVFAPFAESGATPGRVVRVDRGSVVVATPDGDRRTPIAGRLRSDPPEGGVTAGDWVALDGGLVCAVLPRRTVFLRKVAGLVSESQAIAANIDVGLVVSPLGNGVNLRRIERTLAMVWSSGARPAVLLTKSDLSDDLDRDLSDAASAANGAEVHACSAVDATGVEALRALLTPGVTAALIGPSGAGKSTLVNLARGSELLATAAVRDDGRGRHTTTHRELVALPGGALVVDTPGMRELGMWDSAEGIDEEFADVLALAAQCRFSDCAHRSEPGCAVRDAVRSDPRLHARVESHRKLEREQRRIEARVEGYVRAQRHRDIRTFSRALRSRPDKRSGW
jgi:ribosome biogenesis GTPase / thiamine phosphate phosphatase